jgi:hypothetical protein
MTASRTFSSHYRSGLVFLSAPGLLVAPLFVAPGAALLHSLQIAVIVTALSLLISGLIWTWMRRRKPALFLSGAGVEIDGLPSIAWPEIAGIGPKGADPNVLELRLREPPSRTRGPFSRGRVFVTPVWRPAPPRGIVLRTSLLQDARSEIENAFGYFLNRGAQSA